MLPEVITGLTVNIHAMTDVGRSRSHNEDNFIVCQDLKEKRWYVSEQPEKLSESGCLLVVADGMGGANAGEIASHLAVEAIRKSFDSLEITGKPEVLQAKEVLGQAISDAHKAILAASDESPEYFGMGTTILVAWVFSDKAVIGWCGDSRAYLYRKRGGIQILTKDHSLVWDLVEAGKLTPDEADIHPDNNIITQSLGEINRLPEPDFTVCSLEEKDRLLLCSDGLNNMLNRKALEAILGANIPLPDANKKLIEAANQEGGTDNITVVSLEVLQGSSQKEKAGFPWLLTGAFIFFIVGGLVFYMIIPKGLFGYYEAPHTAERALSVTKAKIPEPAILTIKPESSSTNPVPEEEAKRLTESDGAIRLEETSVPGREALGFSSEVSHILAKYHFLDSVLNFQESRKREAVPEKESQILAGGTKEPNTEAEQELLDLINKYELGLSKESGIQKEFLDSISTKYKLTIQDISTELSRIDYLIHHKKAD